MASAGRVMMRWLRKLVVSDDPEPVGDEGRPAPYWDEDPGPRGYWISDPDGWGQPGCIGPLGVVVLICSSHNVMIRLVLDAPDPKTDSYGFSMELLSYVVEYHDILVRPMAGRDRGGPRPSWEFVTWEWTVEPEMTVTFRDRSGHAHVFHPATIDDVELVQIPRDFLNQMEDLLRELERPLPAGTFLLLPPEGDG